MYKNIIYITGNNAYAIKKEVARWKWVFREKYGNENIDTIGLDEKNRYFEIRDNLTTTGLFSLKRLFIFSGGRIKRGKTEWAWFSEIIERIASEIPNDHFLLFYALHPKEEELIFWLKKNADVKIHNTLWDFMYWKSVFEEIDESITKKVLRSYELWSRDEEGTENTAHFIGRTFEMLEMLPKSEHESNWKNYISTGESMSGDFDLSDALIHEKYENALSIFEKMSSSTDISKILPNLIWQLRNTLYLKYLVHTGMRNSEIELSLKIHPFVQKKSLAAPISYEKISHLLFSLISLDRAYKSGKWMKNAEQGKKLGLEKIIFGLKK